MMLDIRVGGMGDQLHLESRKGLIFLKILEQERRGQDTLCPSSEGPCLSA